MLLGYLDDSGTDMKDGVVVVAGFIGSERYWTERFKPKWQRFLAEYELTRFHSTEFLSRARPYRDWPVERYQRAKQDIRRILVDMNPFGFGTAVSVEAFREYRSRVEYFVDPDPYFFCLQRCLRTMIRSIASATNDDGIRIIVDRDSGRQRTGEEIARWHRTRLKANPPDHVNPDREVEIEYGSSFNHLPLQLADILAHGSYQEARNRLQDTPNPESYFIHEMRSSGVPVRVENFLDREMFDIEHKRQTT
jgi:hypothetical protein